MTRQEYDFIQNDLRAKLSKPAPHGYNAREREAYKQGILACMSILKQHFSFHNM